MMFVAAAVALMLTACTPQTPDTTLVLSSDPELRARVAELLPDLAQRARMDLTHPIRAERRTREELERYLLFKLDEEFPAEDAARLTRSYALLGLMEPDTDLRALLLSVYTEQVAGFYDPDSTALFLLEDMPMEALEPVIVHELVHAVQDQTSNLDSLTAEERGNDRRAAAQSAIEGHATLLMLEYMAEMVQNQPVDISALPNFSDAIGPVLEGMRDQYPALAEAPSIVQESLLFPYLRGASFVADLWTRSEGRPPPFGEYLPQSTEQIMNPEKARGPGLDLPTVVTVQIPDGMQLEYRNTLGQMELQVLVQETLGAENGALSSGWDGDEYVLLSDGKGAEGLVWASVWDSAAERDRFLSGFAPALTRLGAPATLAAVTVQARPAALLRIGIPDSIPVLIQLSDQEER